jgi:hypothetical protein
MPLLFCRTERQSSIETGKRTPGFRQLIKQIHLLPQIKADNIG